MSRTFAWLAVLTLLPTASCVTRAKHDRTVTGWEGKLGKCVAERDRVTAELKGELVGANERLRSTADDAAAREAELSRTIDASQAELAELRKQRAIIEAQMRQFRKLEDAFRNMIGAGEIKVYRRRGRIMVALPASVLFASGKADLSKPGAEALAKVAGVLGKLKKRRFLVAGHTDTRPIKTERFPDNWSLSAERATVVTRFMIENGVSPKMLASAGYGQYDPVSGNRTRRGRKNNRRIEIILMPNINELPKFPPQKKKPAAKKPAAKKPAKKAPAKRP